MSYPQAHTVNRLNPVPVSVITQAAGPQVTYDQVALCADPNCPVCRAQRRDKRIKHTKKRHHHHRHHHQHRGHRTNFWNSLLPRVESPLSTVSVHSIELNDRRVYDHERAIVPVNQTERQVVSTSRTRPIRNEEIVDDAWVKIFPSIRFLYHIRFGF